MSSPKDRKKEWLKLKMNAKTQYCRCGEPLLKRNGSFLFFRKPRIENGIKSDINIIVEVISQEPVGFMFTCGNCGVEQTPIVTLKADSKAMHRSELVKH
jgi:hypothetical protein